jgi:hypothetical protein
MIAFDEVNTLCYSRFSCCCQITWLSFLDVDSCFAFLLVTIKVSNFSSQIKLCGVVHVVNAMTMNVRCTDMNITNCRNFTSVVQCKRFIIENFWKLVCYKWKKEG